MRFRFPRSTVFLMVLIFASTVFAIEQGRKIASVAWEVNVETPWPGLAGLFVYLGIVAFSLGAVAYLLMLALRQSGFQRIPHIRTWAGRK
jgi:hypothetical protein